ncbi:hypothetical protein HYDPIDRAFT_115850 [Hydnomerulius pinastri MD-312]|uniref:RING-type domain-containing protein n=1 Tax=Hydnomerulius pinastri MD-312 TaxID=994086 RepID=A0A0C9VTQ0_9AGAM|nr:hypothetical protein HYDPIDRAFT_31267 [Hydnomerulius pinastri MD-312]KIJ61396.1 hypothetical protein HYDPIDRAFT_115850 [Hydnomerulius pinastri MD-312]
MGLELSTAVHRDCGGAAVEHLNKQHTTGEGSALNEMERSLDRHEQSVTSDGQVTGNEECTSLEEALPEDVGDVIDQEGSADRDHHSPTSVNKPSLTNEEFHGPLSSPVLAELSLSFTPPSHPSHEGDTSSTSGTVHGEDHSEAALSPPSSPSCSSQSTVFISADGIPEYVRENRAYLVATSATSPSSDRSPVLLPSSSSLESLELPQEPPNDTAQFADSAKSTTRTVSHPLHCMICQRDPCKGMTATTCGHIFCKNCITQAVAAKSECPVCESATLF